MTSSSSNWEPQEAESKDNWNNVIKPQLFMSQCQKETLEQTLWSLEILNIFFTVLDVSTGY